MVKKSKKRASTNPNSASSLQESKKFNIEISVDKIKFEGETFEPITFNNPYLEYYLAYNIPYIQQDLILDEIEPIGIFSEEHNIREAFIYTGKKIKVYYNYEHNRKEWIDQEVLFIKSSLTKETNILKVFVKEPEAQVPLKPSNVRANLNSGLRRFVKKMINGWPKLKVKAFEGTGKNRCQIDAFNKLNESIIENKKILEDFNTFSLTKKVSGFEEVKTDKFEDLIN